MASWKMWSQSGLGGGDEARFTKGRQGRKQEGPLPDPGRKGKLCFCRSWREEAGGPSWPGTAVTICVSYFTTSGLSKEHGTNKPPATGKVQEKSKGDDTSPTTSENPTRWHLS